MTARLLDLTVDLSCRIGLDGTFLELSEGWTELLGSSCERMIGRPVIDFVHPDDVARTRDVLAGAGRSGQDIVRFENRLLAEDGSARWLLWNAIALPGEPHYHVVARDLTLRREAEARLQESERRYLDLIESSHDIVQSIAPDGHFEFVNRAWHELLGYTPEELPQMTLFDIVDAADHDHCNVIIGQLMTGQSFTQIEVTFVAKDGRRIPVEGNATGRFRDGTYVATHAFFRDISERKKADELSAQYQQRLEREVAERTTALVQSEKLATLGRLSAGMAHELNNPAAAAVRGAVQLRDALSQTCASFFALAEAGLARDEAERLADLVTESAARAKVPDALDPMTRSDREAEIEDWLDARGLEGSWELAGPLVSLDVDPARLDELAARFDATRLPLVLQLMCQSHVAFALLEQIAQGSERISEIVTALKAYSFMDRAPVQDVDVHEGLDNTLVMLQGELKRGVKVERDYCTNLPRIEARGSELNQVWTNLIDNAVDAMGGRGRLLLRTFADDEAITVEVEDDGPGIDPTVVDKVFDPFFTTKPPGQGTGLGLNIVYSIVRGLGGTIDVQSRPGSTVFRVRLPIQGAGARPDPGAA